ncbi:MAG: DNA repair protein RecO [Chitinophagales bacterium]
MLHKTKGIVLKTTKYSETSIIAKVYTEKFGLQSYMINGVRSAKSKGKSALYQHGNILDMVVYHKESGNLFHVSEVRMDVVFTHIPFNIVKSASLLFCIELLLKTIKEEEANNSLFQFLQHAIIFLDETSGSLANYHLVFLLQLSKYAGFFPNDTEGAFFNLQEGNFQQRPTAASPFMDAPASKALRNLIHADFSAAQQIPIDYHIRKELLQKLLLYYSLHIDHFGEMHSPEILEEVFRK